MDCKRATANSHAIQDKVLRLIAANNNGTHEVIDFMDINTARIATECQGPNGELWHRMPWDIESLPPRRTPTTTASARHFACNQCDNATFRPIEDEPIPWPSTHTAVTVDNTKSSQSHSYLSDPLFLLAYRCLLQHISHFRGLISADDYAAIDQQTSDSYRTVLTTRKAVNQRILDKLTNLKTKYDRRLTGIALLPMTHRVVPVKPAFPFSSTAFTPAGNGHIASTVYPVQIKAGDGTMDTRHWMVISVESASAWAVKSTTQALETAALNTLQAEQSSIDWTVERILTAGALSTYANPDAYTLFCQQHPDSSAWIERRVTDTIVVEYYQRLIGLALKKPGPTSPA